MSSAIQASGSGNPGSFHDRYEGQMGMQNVELDSSSAVVSVTDSALGARGVDALSKTTSSGTVISYPLYDAHRNMVSTLAKSGSGYSYSAVRTFDAWGSVRSGGSAGDPAGKYCANLGHKQDDESGLVYMRARYYEPTSGRFVSQDLMTEGFNWYVYCANNPISFVDESGNTTAAEHAALGAMFALLGMAFAILGTENLTIKTASSYVSLAGIGVGLIFGGLAAFNYAFALAGVENVGSREVLKFIGKIGSGGALGALIVGLANAWKSLGGLGKYAGAVGVAAAIEMGNYLAQCVGALICIEEGW